MSSQSTTPDELRVRQLLYENRAVWLPPPDLTISQWADAERRISPEASAEPGIWRTSRAEYQRTVMDAVSDPLTERIVMMTSAQIGKALDVDTPIATVDGWKRIADLTVGDVVFDEMGEQCHVLWRSEIMSGRTCYRIVFSDGNEIIADAEHNWAVDYESNNGAASKQAIMTTREMAPLYKNGKRNRFAISVSKPLNLEDKDLLVEPYLLGLWLGDGHSCSALITTSKDDVEIYDDLIAAGHRVIFNEHPGEKAYTVQIDPYERGNICIHGHNMDIVGRTKQGYCAECARQSALYHKWKGIKEVHVDPVVNRPSTFFSKLKTLGVLKNKHIPAVYLRASYQQRLELLRGLMDTDGYISSKGICDITLKSRRLIGDVEELLHSLGLKPVLKPRLAKCKDQGKEIVSQVWRLIFMAYADMPVFKLKRKLSRMMGREGRRTTKTERRRIIAIEEVKSRPVCCIAVDSPSRLYLAGKAMIPTHNSEILLNIVGYYIDQEPSPILLLDPTLEMGQAFSKDRLAPMIRDTPALQGKIKDPRSRDSGNTLLHKSFPGGHITIAGANSPASLASRPIRVLLCDEVDRYPISAGTEGDPLSLAAKRTQNFWNRRIVWVSTPTIMGISRIEKAFEVSTQEHWCIPCPTCGEYQPYEWGRIVYKDLPEPLMVCSSCGASHTETEWKAGQERGIWIARREGDRHTRGFHLNAFASPWATWGNLIDQYQEAYQNGEEELKVWWNTVLGLPWENQSGTIEVETMESHREEYAAELPDGVLVLTCGVDTQDDRLEAEVVGWGVGKESWGIEYRIFYGDPGQAEVWQALDDFLSKLWAYANGERIGLSCTCIDSAGHFTDEVYRFCKPRARRNIFPIVGRGREGLPSVGKPSRNNRRHVALFALGVTTIKGSLFSRLRIERPGPGYCHFPLEAKTNHRGYDGPYFKGLLSERMVVKKVRGRETISWEPRSVGIRNEPLDTRVYATGALELYNPNLEMHRRRRGTKKMPTRPPEVRKNPVPPPPSAEKPETQASSQAATQPTTQTAPKTTPTKGRGLRRSVQVLRHGMKL